MNKAVEVELKTPPHSLEAEQSVIGALLLDSSAWDKVADSVTATDFYREDHRVIFNAISGLANSNCEVDAVTVFERLVSEGRETKSGGLTYLAELARNTPTALNVASYAKIVRRKALQRHLIAAANNIADLAFDPKTLSDADLLNVAEKAVFDIRDSRTSDTTGPQQVDAKMLSSFVEELDLLCKGEADVGLKTGYGRLDEKLGGLQKQDLVIIAARPSVGKTTLAMNICDYVSLNNEKPVLVFSMEMPTRRIIRRRISSLGQIDFKRLKDGKLVEHEWDSLHNVMTLLKSKSKMIIDETGGLTPLSLRARARRALKEHGGLSLIMVDYLQLMQSDEKAENRTNEIGEISRALKALAKELDVPVIALSQLNRGVENRNDKRPSLADLRESGAIEQDADTVMFIYRDEVYFKDKENNKGKAEIIIAKQRDGETGTVHLSYAGRYMRFTDTDYEATENS